MTRALNDNAYGIKFGQFPRSIKVTHSC
jgi:hypothetical protein